jgi:DNA repair exonuclease SbcCD ATPase subunit
MPHIPQEGRKRLEQIDARLDELDLLLWAKNRKLSAACIPYDMDKEWAALDAEEKRLKEEKEELLKGK